MRLPLSRRRLLGVAGGALVAPKRAGASDCGARVIVRTRHGLVAVDPRTGDTDAWRAGLPATPAAGSPAPVIPDVVALPVTEGTVGYWMSAPGAAGFIFRYDSGPASTWWWRHPEGRATKLDLPGELEPALPVGTTARWFHGATIDARHLGAGTLRLLAVDIETGETVLDHALDRRLELAATAVSDDGAIVAHVQSAATGVAFWAADLRDGTRVFDANVVEEPAIAAASSIDLKVVADGDAVLAAAGLVRDSPGAPAPTVHVMHAVSPNDITTTSHPGELVDISHRP